MAPKFFFGLGTFLVSCVVLPGAGSRMRIVDSGGVIGNETPELFNDAECFCEFFDRLSSEWRESVGSGPPASSLGVIPLLVPH